MRPSGSRLLAISVCAAALVIGTPFAAQAYWQATAQSSLSVAPASFAVTPSTTDTGSFTGASGTTYVPVALADAGDVPLAARTSLTVAPVLAARTDSGSLAVTVAAVLAVGGADCSAATGYSAPEPVGVSTDPISLTGGADSDSLLCLAFAYTGATDADDGTTYTVSVGVSAAAGSWNSATSSTPVTFAISSGTGP